MKNKTFIPKYFSLYTYKSELHEIHAKMNTSETVIDDWGDMIQVQGVTSSYPFIKYGYQKTGNVKKGICYNFFQ